MFSNMHINDVNFVIIIVKKITSLCVESFDKLEEIFLQEYDDVDFQSNSIMKSLIPNGFCFQYISYNKCNKPMCKYRHDVPSKVWLVLLFLWRLFKEGWIQSDIHQLLFLWHIFAGRNFQEGDSRDFSSVQPEWQKNVS